MTRYAVKLGQYYLVRLTGNGGGVWDGDLNRAMLYSREKAGQIAFIISANTAVTARIVAVEVARREVEA